MKTLTLSIFSLATMCVTAGAQDATPTGSTAQADKQFLQQLEHDGPASSPANQPSATPADEKQPKSAPVAKQVAPVRRASESEPVKKTERTVAASASGERSQDEARPVEKKVKKDAGTKVVTNTEKVAPSARGDEEPIENHAVRKVNQDRTARTTPLDPFYETAGHAPISSETKPAKVSHSSVQPPPEVAAGAPQTVTVTKTTTTTVPASTPKAEDDGFLHRLFHHKDRSGGE